MISEFLRTELRPSPARWRATARVTVACVVGTGLIMWLQMPSGYWVIITILVMSQPNAGASLVRGFQRLVATSAGAVAAIGIIVAFSQQPWFEVAALSLLCGFGLFLSQTSTAPYVGLLSAMTPAILVGLAGENPVHGVEEGLWRGAAVGLGVVIGTAAQLLVLPEEPERLLHDDLAAALAQSAHELLRLSAGGAPGDVDPRLRDSAFQGLGRQLDWLSNAEALHRGLRQRHGEQLVLIGAVHRFATATLGLGEALEGAAGGPALSPGDRARVARLLPRVDLLRAALLGRPLPPAPPDAPEPPASVAVEPALVELSRSLDEMEAAAGFLGVAPPGHPPPGRSILDDGESPFFLTPAFSIRNVPALRFAMKGGLAAGLCFVVVKALHWPAIGTCVVTAVIVAQTSFGAMVQKASLRLAGAVVGGILAVATVVALVPAMDTIASLLPVTALAMGIAAYVLAGSARISYAGIQLGLAWVLTVLHSLGPSTALAEPLDRVIGVVIGIVVGLAVFRFVWPELASVKMRSSLDSALRHLADLSRVSLPTDPSESLARPQGGYRWAVTRDFIDAMRLASESRLEPQSRADVPRRAQEALVRVLDSTQASFLALLAVVRHRLNAGVLSEPAEAYEPLHALALAIRPTFTAVAERVERGDETALPALRPMLDASRRAIRRLEERGDAAIPNLPGFETRLALYELLVVHLERLDARSREFVAELRATRA